MEKRFLALAGMLAGLAVATGAFAAHMLKFRISVEMLDVFKTGAKYQMYHAIALAIVALTYKLWPRPMFLVAGWFFISGILLFSGSLYVMSITGNKWFGIITPFGGLCFLTGWTLYVLAAFKLNR